MHSSLLSVQKQCTQECSEAVHRCLQEWENAPGTVVVLQGRQEGIDRMKLHVNNVQVRRQLHFQAEGTGREGRTEVQGRQVSKHLHHGACRQAGRDREQPPTEWQTWEKKSREGPPLLYRQSPPPGRQAEPSTAGPPPPKCSRNVYQACAWGSIPGRSSCRQRTEKFT
jgi:hypothetical protein